MKIIAVIILFATLFGCATMINGRTQLISIDSKNPSHQKVILDGYRECITPCELVVARESDHTMNVDGKKVHLSKVKDISYFRNLIWIHPLGWLIGILVDLETGAAYKIEPEHIIVDGES
jgi:hypothetical protein